MRTPLRLLLLAAFAVAAAPSSVSAGDAVGASPVNPALHVSADLHDEYLTGVPWLVTVVVRNDGDQPTTFPDLSARPHLVRFVLDGTRGRTERYSTPPAKDAGSMWSLPPHSERRVTLEVPSSAGLVAGGWRLTVRIADPAAPFELPPQTLIAATPRVTGGQPVWEPTIAANTGAMTPWVHQATKGFDLYLAWSQPKHPETTTGHYYLAHLDRAADPVLSLARPSDAQSRYIYWQQDAQTITAVRLDGHALRGAPRQIALPYPSVALLGQGATDAKGGLMVPLWIPAPKGSAGEVRVLCVDERGSILLRSVGTFPHAPTVTGAAVTSASNLLLAIADETGILLYEVNPAAAPELPARGMRVWKREGGWDVAGIRFDVLPDSDQQPGGLSMLSVLTRRESETTTARTLWSDISGKVFLDAPSGQWTATGRLLDLLSGGYGAWYALTEDNTGARWLTAAGGTPTKTTMTGPAALWSSAESVYVRSLGGPTVIRDQPVLARAP